MASAAEYRRSGACEAAFGLAPSAVAQSCVQRKHVCVGGLGQLSSVVGNHCGIPELAGYRTGPQIALAWD
ncbi:MAG: hypothetical protein AW07_00075 [Candidatus Accumulibacter sp. SK-11]|nr:MAG: hypothetical protein AW07_00075 [Candidatus Accumulibacter sp. SK-11]